MVASESRRKRRQLARQRSASTTRAAGLHNANIQAITTTDGDTPTSTTTTTTNTTSQKKQKKKPPPKLPCPILALPTELSQHILRYTLTDADIAHDPTNPLELVAQHRRLRLVCWKWHAEMEHVLGCWKRRREAMLPALEGKVARWEPSQKAEEWLAMREEWKRGRLGDEEVERLEERWARRKMQKVRKWKRCRVKREIAFRRMWEEWKAVRRRRGMMKHWKRGVKLMVSDAHRRGVRWAKGLEPMPAFYHPNADDELEWQEWAEDDEMEDNEQTGEDGQMENNEQAEHNEQMEDNEQAEEDQGSEQMNTGE